MGVQLRQVLNVIDDLNLADYEEKVMLSVKFTKTYSRKCSPPDLPASFIRREL